MLTSQETEKSLQKFLEPTRKPKVFYTENSQEIGKACEDLSWNRCTSKPHRSGTNGIAERAVHRIRGGTSAVLLQSGLDEKRWADSMECNCYLRNIQDLLSDGGGSEYHSMARLFCLERWWNIALLLLKTCRACVSSAQKSCQVFSLDMRYTRWESDHCRVLFLRVPISEYVINYWLPVLFLRI